MKITDLEFSDGKTYEFTLASSKASLKRRFFYGYGENFYFPSAVKKIWQVGKDLYLMDTDGFLYKRENGVFTMVSGTQFGVNLKFIPVVYGGTEKTLVVTPTVSEVAGGGQGIRVSVPFGDILRFYAGRLFIAKDRTLYFSELFNFVSFSLGENKGGFINVENTDGNIVGLEEKDGKLYVICENTVISLSAFVSPNDFKAERLSTAHLGAKAGTVAKVGADIYFSDGNSLKKFDGKKVETASITLSDYSDFGEAESFAGKYVLSVKNGGSQYSYVYEDQTKEEAVIPLIDTSVSGGAVTADTDSGKMLRICAETETYTDEIDSNYDFGTSKIKVVLAVDLKVKGGATLNLKGENGGLKKVLSTGEHYIKTCVSGRIYSFFFTQKTEDFYVERIKIIYGVKGG